MLALQDNTQLKATGEFEFALALDAAVTAIALRSTGSCVLPGDQTPANKGCYSCCLLLTRPTNTAHAA